MTKRAFFSPYSAKVFHVSTKIGLPTICTFSWDYVFYEEMLGKILRKFSKALFLDDKKYRYSF